MRMPILIVKQQSKRMLKSKYYIVFFLSFFLKNDLFSQKNDSNLLYIIENGSRIVTFNNQFILKESAVIKDGCYLMMSDKDSLKTVGYLCLRNNLKHGVEIYSPNNKIIRSAQYVNDSLHGWEFIYNASGRLIEKNNYYKNNLIFGERFDNLNQPIYSLTKCDTLYIEKTLDLLNSIIKIDTLLSNKSLYSSTTFCNANIILYFKNRTKDVKFAFHMKYCDGKTKIKATCLKNNLSYVGKYEEYHPNGYIKTKGQFKNTTTTKEANLKIGNWYFYDSEGNLKKSEQYSSTGQLININELK